MNVLSVIVTTPVWQNVPTHSTVWGRSDIASSAFACAAENAVAATAITRIRVPILLLPRFIVGMIVNAPLDVNA